MLIDNIKIIITNEPLTKNKTNRFKKKLGKINEGIFSNLLLLQLQRKELITDINNGVFCFSFFRSNPWGYCSAICYPSGVEFLNFFNEIVQLCLLFYSCLVIA